MPVMQWLGMENSRLRIIILVFWENLHDDSKATRGPVLQHDCKVDTSPCQLFLAVKFGGNRLIYGITFPCVVSSKASNKWQYSFFSASPLSGKQSGRPNPLSPALLVKMVVWFLVKVLEEEEFAEKLGKIVVSWRGGESDENSFGVLAINKREQISSQLTSNVGTHMFCSLHCGSQNSSLYGLATWSMIAYSWIFCTKIV
jgi:hypothetical protein